jgi:uncharacterized membrane protein YdjX (TVP38/TMEM64 family)
MTTIFQTPDFQFRSPRSFLSSQPDRFYKSLALGCAGLVGWYFRQDLVQFLAMVGDRDAIVMYLERFGGWGLFILSLLLFLQVFVAFIPGHVLMIAGAYLYGLPVGFAVTMISVVASSQMAYLMARKFGRPLVDRVVPEKALTKWDKFIARGGAPFFLFTFVLPIFPTDAMTFVAGLSPISTRKYLAVNILGHVPTILLMGLIGAYGVQLPLVFWVFVGIAMAGLYAAWRLYANKINTSPMVA